MPPYIVFSDKTLLEMVRVEPVDMDSFARVEGVGEKKTVKYWKPFVTAIRKFKGIAESLGTGLSHEETLLLLNAGYVSTASPRPRVSSRGLSTAISCRSSVRTS